MSENDTKQIDMNLFMNFVEVRLAQALRELVHRDKCVVNMCHLRAEHYMILLGNSVLSLQHP